MEIPWLTRLNIVDLQCSADGDQMHYLAHDRATGKIFKISHEIAQAVAYCKQLTSIEGMPIDKEKLKVAFGFLGSLQNMHKMELSRKKTFNPLFINVDLFDVGPLQKHLKGMAQFWVGRAYWTITLTLLAIAFWLGSWSDWEIVSVFKNIFSLNAIATFAIAAPFLKIIHELGHTLAATKFSVRVRKSGLFLIGLYPMPFVDCTDADLSATRTQRIIISLAGLFTDILVALIAFIAWHFVEGTFLKTLLGNIFMFSSINSVLFNANPLIKLDGYYALADALRIRNMHTEASQNFRNFRLKIMTFGRGGNFPQNRRARLLSLYSFASVLYKTNMILGILWIVLPKYFGLGVILALWGGYAMFFSPMMRTDNGAKPTKGKPKTLLFWILLFAAIGAALFFVKMPFRTVVPVSVDVEGKYSLQSQASGFIEHITPQGAVEENAVLLVLSNPELNDLLKLYEHELETARYALEAVSGIDPARAIIAEEKVHSIETRLSLTAVRIENMTIRALSDGSFSPDQEQFHGNFIPEGGNFGALYPNAVDTFLVGAFPERYVEKFLSADPVAEVRLNGEFMPPDFVQSLNLVQTVSIDAESGTRSYRLSMPVNANPNDLNGADIYVKLLFPEEQLYSHAQFFIANLVQKFRDAKLAQN